MIQKRSDDESTFLRHKFLYKHEKCKYRCIVAGSALVGRQPVVLGLSLGPLEKQKAIIYGPTTTHCHCLREGKATSKTKDCLLQESIILVLLLVCCSNAFYCFLSCWGVAHAHAEHTEGIVGGYLRGATYSSLKMYFLGVCVVHAVATRPSGWYVRSQKLHPLCRLEQSELGQECSKIVCLVLRLLSFLKILPSNDLEF